MLPVAARFPAVFAALLFLFACQRPEPGDWPVPLARSADSLGCGEYVFDSALANLEYVTPLMVRASRILPYAPADTNTFGWTQLRYALLLESPSEIRRPYTIIHFHGGGGDVGHATNVDNTVLEFLENGYDVWSVEYRRGWHAGSYDPCLPRDPFSATAEDFNRFDTAVVWALRDVRTALSRIAAYSTDSFLLYGTSFGAHLAMMCGPFDDPVRTDRNRVKGVMALYGSVRAGLEPRSRIPTFLLHGERDSLNGPDRAPLFGIDPPVGRYVDGSRAIYSRLRDYMPTWLMMHGAGHGTGGLTASALKGIAEETLINPRVPTGRYRLLPDGSIITGPPGGGPSEGP